MERARYPVANALDFEPIASDFEGELASRDPVA